MSPAATPASWDECAGESAVDVVDHSVELTVSLAPRSLSGVGDVRVRATRATGVAVLDARDLQISDARAVGKPAAFHLTDGRVCVRLPRSLASGEESVLHFVWTTPTDHDVPHFSATDVWAGYTTSAWMPTRLDSAQRATLHLRIHAPPSLTVVGSGRRILDRENARSDSFVVDVPSPPFLFAFAAGRFDETTLDTPHLRLRALVPPGVDPGEVHDALVVTAQSLAFLERSTGTLLPLQEYTQVFVSGEAAQEAVGMAVLSVDALADLRKDPKEDWVFTHELAHQWFGVWIPCDDFHDFWLNEGFATFLTGAAKERRWGSTAYDHELVLWRQRSARVHEQANDAPLALSLPAPLPSHDAGLARGAGSTSVDAKLQPRGVTYSRGALVLAKLRAELGDEAFWSGIQTYAHDRRLKGARTSDVRVALEAASGRDLAPFFAKWVYAAAYEL